MLRGTCYGCKRGVYTNQERTCDSDGDYWHQGCWESAQLGATMASSFGSLSIRQRRDTCPGCGRDVYSTDSRTKDADGDYWHDSCHRESSRRANNELCTFVADMQSRLLSAEQSEGHEIFARDEVNRLNSMARAELRPGVGDMVYLHTPGTSLHGDLCKIIKDDKDSNPYTLLHVGSGSRIRGFFDEGQVIGACLVLPGAPIDSWARFPPSQVMKVRGAGRM